MLLSQITSFVTFLCVPLRDQFTFSPKRRTNEYTNSTPRPSTCPLGGCILERVNLVSLALDLLCERFNRVRSL